MCVCAFPSGIIVCSVVAKTTGMLFYSTICLLINSLIITEYTNFQFTAHFRKKRKRKPVLCLDYQTTMDHGCLFLAYMVNATTKRHTPDLKIEANAEVP